jgi:manganese-dependent inorganic pyrophosphatase
MKGKILVTGYMEPDLDGTACAYAYAEFLKIRGEDVVAGAFGKPHREAQFVLDRFKINGLENAEKLAGKCKWTILVDASDYSKGVSRKIKPADVIEVIDHRKINEAHKFPNAKVQIELVGAAATLIAEKFHAEKIPISKESALLLYAAIASNTINFKAPLTTERDIKMAQWLSSKAAVPKDLVHDMFVHKSRLDKPLKQVLIDDAAFFTFGGKSLAALQLEIVDAEKFVESSGEKIRKAIEAIKKETKCDLIYLSLIDVEKAYNIFMVIDEASANLLNSAVKVRFSKDTARTSSIIMRKQTIPLIKEVLER